MDNDNKVIPENEIPENETENLESSENLSENKSLTAKDFIPESQKVHKEVRMFLDSELTTLYRQNKLQSYDLKTEYEETKKHKSPFALIVLGICFAIVLGTVIVMTAVISSKDRNIQVEMNVFDDLNLKDLLDTVSKVQANYDDAVKRRSNLLNDREVALKNAETKREQEIYIIKSTKLSAREEKKKLDEVEVNYNSEIQAIQSEFEPKISVVETEIRDYESQLKEYDSSKVQAAQEQERMINSERRVQELERRKLTQQYEDRIAELERTIEDLRQSNSKDVMKSVSSMSSKYQAEVDGLDPKIIDVKAEEIVSEAKSNQIERFNGLEIAEETDDITVSNGFKNYQSAYDSYEYLYKYVSSLPQKNTIPSYVAASNNLVNDMGKTFETTTLALEKDKVILQSNVTSLKSEVRNLENDYDGLVDEYNELVDEMDTREVQYKEEILAKQQEMEELKTQHSQEMAEAMTEAEEQFEKDKEALHKEFVDIATAQQAFYESAISGVITSSKALAAVIQADAKDNIRVFVNPDVMKYVTSAGIPAEIKASKSIKGTIVKDEDRFCKFVPAADFDFATVTPGLIVKLSIKK